MPQFSPSEREKLLQDLIDTGRKLFVAQGLKKTSLDQLTQAVGIAKSTFYTFFDSKEAMYLELLELEATGMENRVWEAVAKTAHVRDGITAYLRQMVRELDTNPLTQRLLTHPEELDMVKRRVSPEFIERKLRRNVVPLMKYIDEQQQLGLMIDGEPSVIVGVIRAAMLPVVHRKEIGEQIYPQVVETLFRAVSSVLTQSPNKKEE